jgi:hypothetical protein
VIEKLTEQREEHKQSCINNNDNSHAIIADLYSDPTHFIFEIIQNAEDAKAKYINFSLIDNNLGIEHNGDEFTYNEIDKKYSDIHSITTVGNSTKKDDINKIGKFGAGFKSVFAVTNAPKIHSGKYHFEIKDFIIPIEIDPINLENNITKIILPLKNEEVKEKISEKIQNLEMETLLFLNNINEINYQTKNENGHYIKDDDNLNKNNKFGKIFIISKKNKEEQNQEYFIINDNVKIDNKDLKISVAYNMKNNKIIKSSNSFLSVFFPTKIDTNLNFLLQAPYRTTPNRETIPFDNEENQILTKRLSKLVAESLNIIKEEKLLDVDFLELLPIERFERNNFYMEIYSSVKEAIQTNSYMPTNNNSFDSVNNLLLARGKELANLLDCQDLNVIWKKQNWLNANITQDKTSKLRDYLIKELNIEEITFEKFARALNTDFLKQKSDNWLINFYSNLSEQEALFRDFSTKKSVLRNKNIVKLEDETFTSLYDQNNRLQIYKPPKEKSEFKTVKKIFIEDQKSKIFFENYGVTYPNKFSELKEFIYPKYQSEDINISFDEYEKDIEKITNIYNSQEKEEKKKEIINLFKDSYIVYSSNNTFKKPQDIYFPTDDLKLWFKNNENIDFVNNQIYNDNTKNIFDLFGCLKIPKRIKFEPNINNSEYRSIKQYSTRQNKIIDYNIDCLENNLDNISLEISLLLWKYILQYANNDSNSYLQPKFYEGKYEFFYRTEQSKKFKAKFIKLLKSKKWLYNKNEDLIDLKNITIDELNDLYKKDDEKIEVLERLFEFKLDDIKKFEENHPDKAIIDKNEYEEFKKYQEQKDKNEKIENNEWEEKVNPNDINIHDIEILENNITIQTDDLSDQQTNTNPDTEHDGNLTDFDPKNNQLKVSKKTKDAIGNWGEKLIYKKLQDKYSKENKYFVRWGNQDNNTSKGYDFVILKDNKEVLYIEVKSKVDKKPELISITGTQWEWARKLYNQNQGEKYQIYVVSNVNTKNPKLRIITDPIKEWKDGKLKAHPVNFEL